MAELARATLWAMGRPQCKFCVGGPGWRLPTLGGSRNGQPHLAHGRTSTAGRMVSPTFTVVKDGPPGAYLLPGYDEYTVGYTDRRRRAGSARSAGGDP